MMEETNDSTSVDPLPVNEIEEVQTLTEFEPGEVNHEHQTEEKEKQTIGVDEDVDDSVDKGDNLEDETFVIHDDDEIEESSSAANVLESISPYKELDVTPDTSEGFPSPKARELLDDVDLPVINSDQSDSDILTDMASANSSRPSAEFKYRWSKVVDTASSDVGFYPSYAKNDPVLLSWDEAALAYLSTSMQVECGDFHGNLMIDGKAFPIESFSIRTYTFEVDLFIKEDIFEDEAGANASDVIKDVAGTTPSLTKENDVDSPNMKGYKPYNEETGVRALTKFDSSIVSSIRHSPVGDDAEKPFSESKAKEDPASRPHSVPTVEQTERPSSEISNVSGKAERLVEDVLAAATLRSLNQASVGSINIPELDDSQNIRSIRPPSSGSESAPRSLAGSAKDLAATVISDGAIYGRPLSRSSDRFSPERSGRPSSRDSGGHDDPRTSVSPAHSLNRASPLRTQTPVGSDVPPASVMPQRDVEPSPVRDRIQENGDVSPRSGLVGSRPPSRPPSHPGSRQGSQHSSRAQSLASITSEQELGQYMGNLSRSGSLDKFDPSNVGSHLDNYKYDSPNHREAERPTSVPSYSSQSQPKTDLRSQTPENRVRVPLASDQIAFRGLSAERQERIYGDKHSALSNHSSRASSRTVTPVAAEREAPSPEVKDLEANIVNLRKLLTNRESEVHRLNEQLSDLRDINRSLHADVEHRSKRPVSASREDEALEIKRLLSEKEIMASEIVTLREELTKFKGDNGRSSVSSGISDYSPNSPTVLQRKITDLEAHIRDLQEVNETSTMRLSKAEDKVRYLLEENRNLKAQVLSSSDLQGDGDQHMRVEMRTLREDIRNLKERNFQLTEENMRLNELQKAHNSSSVESTNNKLNTSFRSDDGIVRQSGGTSRWERDRESRYSALPSKGDTRHQSLGSQYRNSREHLAPKELRSSSITTYQSYESDGRGKDTRLLHQRDFIKPPHLGNSKRKDASPSRRSNESPRSNSLQANRSRPDGEVSENLHRYMDSSSFDKKLHETSRGKSYTAKPPTREYRGHDQNGTNARKYPTDGLLQVQDPILTENSDYPSFSSGAALSSQEIFFNLKQKRENRWVQPDSLTDKYSSGNRQGSRYGSRGQTYLDSVNVDDTGDDSDTATDILLAQDGNPKGGPTSSHRRQNSLGSDGSVSSLSDVEDNNNSHYLRRRSKSVDGRRDQDTAGSRQLSTLHRSGSATRPLTSMDSTRGSSGHRSVLPAPLVTQHNKGNIVNTTSLLNSSLTQGMRPFAPRGPSDIRIDDVVKFSRLGGKLSQGVVKYVGHLPGRSDAYLGVELDKDEGKHDGTFEDIRYFKCKPSKGVFVAFNKIVMAWAP